jgi:branched-chain amino acid transport system permease protein
VPPLELLPQTLVNGVSTASIYMMISLGLALVFGVMRVVNLAQGEFMMLAAYGAFWLFATYRVNPYLSITLVVPAALVLGLAVNWVAIRHLVGRSGVNQLLATFGLGLVFQGLAQSVWTADLRRLDFTLPSVTLLGVTVAGVRLINIVVALLVLALLAYFLNRTDPGRFVRATASNRLGAMLCGVDVQRVDAAIFTLGAGLTAVGGVMLALVYFVYPTVGASLILKAFAVVVLGGMGSIAGVIVGSLAIGIAESLVTTYVSSQFTDLVAFAVIFVVLLLRPQGLFGARQA